MNEVSFKEKLELITRVFQENQKFPILDEENGDYFLKLYTCLIYDIVQSQPLACIVDETCLQELVGNRAK